MRKSHKATKTLISYGLLTVLIASCGSSGVNTAAPVDDVSSFEKAIEWSACEGEDAPKAPFECGFVTVPLDYRDATGKTIEIALIRLPASEGEAKGIILTNPGGPGSSGFDFLTGRGRDLVANLGVGSFDLVGFDPRGVDRSNGLKCISDKERDQELYVDYTPDNANEKAIYEKVDVWGAACEKKFGNAMLNYSTEFIARDMDLIRAGMGFEKLNYLGVSYGTYLGGVYATLFPDNVEAMVLDSAFDPQGDTPEQENITQAEGFEKSFKNWIAWCKVDANECEFKSSDIRAAWVALNDKLDKKSLVASDGREVNANVMRAATILAMYDESGWPVLATALHLAEKGDGDELQRLADIFKDRNDDGTYLSSNDSFPIIGCASGFNLQIVEDGEKLLKKLKIISPTFNRNSEASDLEEQYCDDVFLNQKILNVRYSGASPIVVVGGKNDPSTPFRWSEEMTANMGDSAVLVTYTGEGHGHVAASRCVAKIAGLVFTKKQAPKEGTVCKPDVPVAEPTWWKEATRGLEGNLLSREMLDSVIGIDQVEMRVEYRSFSGSPVAFFTDLSKGLEKNGFFLTSDGESDPLQSAQNFASDDGSFRVVFISNKMLLEDGLIGKGTGISPGSNLALLIYDNPLE